MEETTGVRGAGLQEACSNVVDGEVQWRPQAGGAGLQKALQQCRGQGRRRGGDHRGWRGWVTKGFAAVLWAGVGEETTGVGGAGLQEALQQCRGR